MQHLLAHVLIALGAENLRQLVEGGVRLLLAELVDGLLAQVRVFAGARDLDELRLGARALDFADGVDDFLADFQVAVGGVDSHQVVERRLLPAFAELVDGLIARLAVGVAARDAQEEGVGRVAVLVLGGGVDDGLPHFAVPDRVVKPLQGGERLLVAALADGVGGGLAQLFVLALVAH